MDIHMFIRVLLGTLCTLQICFIPVKSDDDPDAALLVGFEKSGVFNPSNYKNLVCVAKGSAANSALLFFSQSQINYDTLDNGLKEVPIESGNWIKYEPFTTVVGKDALLDYRWEGLRSFSSSPRKPMRIAAPVDGAYWTVNLSLKAKKDAYIYLCNGETQRSLSCFWIILGGWENTRSAYRFLKLGKKVQENITEHKLDDKRWNHVTLEQNGNQLKFQHEDFEEAVEIDFNVKYLIFATFIDGKDPVEWRIHDRSFYGTTDNGSHISSEWIFIEENSFCISFFYHIPSSMKNAKLTVGFYDNKGLVISDEIANSEGDTNKGWIRFEKIYNLGYKDVYLRLIIFSTFDGVISTEYPQDLFAVDDISLCNPKGSVRVVKVNIETDKYKGLPSCQLLQFPNVNLIAQEPGSHNLGCSTGRLLSNCSVTCEGLYQGHRDCDNVAICVPDNASTICTCSRGHKGPQCFKCESGSYGDSCSGTCGRCASRQGCHWATGVCSSGCEQGYVTPYCNTTFPRLKKAPSVISASASGLTFTVDFTDIVGYGEPTMYQIQYKMKQTQQRFNGISWQNDAQHDITTKNSNVTLSNLWRLTAYVLRVILFTSDGKYDGNEVPTFEGKTTCDDITVDDIVRGKTFLEVRWHHDDANLACPLHYYTAQLFGTSQRSDNTLEFQEDLHPNFTSLEPYTEYDVKVVSSQNHLLFEKKVSTLEAAPTEPLNLKVVSITGGESILKWDQPRKLNGMLRKFSVNVTMRETWLLMGKVPNITTEHVVTQKNPSYLQRVQGLYPSTSYVVTVSGMTVSSGPQAGTTIQTPLAEPVYNKQLALVEETVTTSTAEVTLPPASEYLTNTSAYFVMVGCDSCPEEESKSRVPSLKGILWDELLNHSRLQNCADKWIAGEIQPKTSEVNFIIGNNTNDSSNNNNNNNNQKRSGRGGHIFGANYVNRPLHPHTTYKVVVVVVSQQGADMKFVTLELPQGSLNLCQVLGKSDSCDELGEGPSAVLIVFLVLIILIIPIIGYIIYKRRKSFLPVSKPQLPMRLTTRHEEDNSCILKPPAPEPQSDIEELDCNLQSPLTERLSCRVAIEDLENYILNGISSGELQKQYSLFPRGQTQPWDYGRLFENKSKNRYGNLVAYDSTRVIMKKIDGDEYSDYINANYIDGYNAKKMYIATQGPKPNTVDDFWRMIWQERVHIIAMLANVVENGKKKCEHYWPDNEKETTHGNVTILTESEQVFADFTVRNLKVTCQGKDRKVAHLHFTSWPDHGVPFYPQSVAGYVKKMLATPRGPGPILVHCSAGVGRTGTIVLVDICLRMAAAERAVDILHYLQSIREQRPNMVDNLEQYKFVHLVLIECLVEEQNSYSCNNLVTHIKEIRETGAIVKQFQRLEELRMQNHIPQHTDPHSGTLPQPSPLLHKNRFQDIVPGRTGRVYLSRNVVQDNTCDYINAVYVDGFRIRDQFIVTQYPLPSTVGDFWRMVVEKNISLIVMLNDLDISETVPEFRPVNEESFTPVPHLSIKLKQKSHTHFWSLLKFQITDSSSAGSPQHQVIRMIQLTGWGADCDLPQEPSVLIHLWQEVEMHYSGKGPTLVMCMDGAKACGLFLACAFVIEKIKLEQQCDVCHAVRTIRQNRKQFIRSQEQFEFLYGIAINYLEAFSIYSNFD